MAPKKDEHIIIVGSGVFGLSTALELATRGYTNITVMDRQLPPVPDGSSVDINRVVRFDYADKVYAKMGYEAVVGWKQDFPKHFHETPVMWITNNTSNGYIDGSIQNLVDLNLPYERLTETKAIQKYNPSFNDGGVHHHGYINPTGGWAHAEGAIQDLAKRCSFKGISFITGVKGTVTSLATSGSRVEGVKTASGDTFYAKEVILATGAWTSQLVRMKGAVLSVAQPIGQVQLTPEEAESLRNKYPICFDMDTGCYFFPPNQDGLLKVARHGWGYESPVNALHSDTKVSGPQLRGPRIKSQFVPEEASESLRDGLRKLVPQFAERPWQRAQLCWYSDTPKGDFILDRHPDYQGLFIATGGSGHALKFLPVLGKYISDCFENLASPELREKWRLELIDDLAKEGDGSRGGPARREFTLQEKAKL